MNKNTFNLFSKELFDLLKTDKGFTVNADLAPYKGKGYAVAVPDQETVINISDLDLGSFTNLLQDYTQRSNGVYFIGAWIADSKVFFDLTQVIDSREDAIELGKASNQLAIFDFNSFNEIKLK